MIINIQVRIPDDRDADWLARCLRLAGFGPAWLIEVGKGQRINGIPLNTILVTIQD